MPMSCGGGMMRTSHQPLAHLVDLTAERWLAANLASAAERQAVERDIAGTFNIGTSERMTFHGQRYLLIISNAAGDRDDPHRTYLIQVHEIARPD